VINWCTNDGDGLVMTLKKAATAVTRCTCEQLPEHRPPQGNVEAMNHYQLGLDHCWTGRADYRTVRGFQLTVTHIDFIAEYYPCSHSGGPEQSILGL
jgi:hypothetical protein